MSRLQVVLAVAFSATVLAESARAQQPGRFSVSIEAASVWSNRNDVRIPPDTGTEFSLPRLIGSGPDAAVRLEATAKLTERHELRFVYAPLRVTGRGISGEVIAFAGGTFAILPTRAEYQFNSYRATYRYRVYAGETWQWRVGFTGFVRDARIALSQPGEFAEDTDVGFVPLGHLRGEARVNDRWRFVLEVDASAAPQGRAIDLLTGATYTLGRGWDVGFGWRTIEGGADVDSVYTFAWLNAAVGRVGLRF